MTNDFYSGCGRPSVIDVGTEHPEIKCIVLVPVDGLGIHGVSEW